jgi:hypothetical protein
MRDAAEHPDLPTQFTQFSKWVARDGGALYHDICLRVADEPSLYGMLDRAEPAQRRPHLLLAAVHSLLLGGADHRLARRYPTVVHARDLESSNDDAGEANAEDLFVDFCRSHRDELAALIETRATQTNEIGRCAGLLPALATVGADRGAPISVIDLGCSAGLNLWFDRYSYVYRRDRVGDVVEAGRPDGTVRIRSALRGPGVPPLLAPAVAQRVGVDLRPADPTDPDQARWLLACLWPHDLERFTRLEAALALAATVPERDRPVLVRGDLVASLGPLADTAPADSALCVVHSWVAAYLTPDEQRALGAAVDEVARRRPVWWIFAESPLESPELPFLPAPDGQPERGATALMLVRVDADGRHPHRLADMHYHGTWLRWWGVP